LIIDSRGIGIFDIVFLRGEQKTVFITVDPV
jgi:hypothetical protein